MTLKSDRYIVVAPRIGPIDGHRFDARHKAEAFLSYRRGNGFSHPGERVILESTYLYSVKKPKGDA